jgi:dihydrofolate reductase
MRLSLIVAASEDDVIGRDGTLPWHLPDDLKHFKALTLGKPIVMGRKTFESIGRALPSRLNLVLSRRADFAPLGVCVVRSLADAVDAAAPAAELMVIGGEAVFAAAQPHASKIHLTRVHVKLHGGGPRFTIASPEKWHETERIEHPADDRHAYAMTFVTLERIGDKRDSIRAPA